MKMKFGRRHWAGGKQKNMGQAAGWKMLKGPELKQQNNSRLEEILHGE